MEQQAVPCSCRAAGGPSSQDGVGSAVEEEEAVANLMAAGQKMKCGASQDDGKHRITRSTLPSPFPVGWRSLHLVAQSWFTGQGAPQKQQVSTKIQTYFRQVVCASCRCFAM